MPVSVGIQWPSPEEARSCPKGDLHLAFCHSCGFIWNRSFDPDWLEYSQRYDNSLDFSPVFQSYARDLARRLINNYGIRQKQVVEIGCGKGYFLTLLCEEGANHGIGFDPSYEGARVRSPAADRITYIQDFFGEKYTSHRCDLICCRHVFEHIPDPAGFLQVVRRTIRDRQSIVYFEMPNVRFLLENPSIWDIIYEHCNYFSRESLAYVFLNCGFDVLRIEEAYGGQFLSIEARLSVQQVNVEAHPDLSGLAAAVHRFNDEVRARSRTWQSRFDQFQAECRRVVVWGGGAKAVSFLNMLKVGGVVSYVVDINPHKQGLYLPGSGQKIVPPDFLREFQPSCVILMNPIYRQEIEGQLRELGVTAEVLDA
jgi:SAM-dependent methyltransferase